jgi:hypothetical protein
MELERTDEEVINAYLNNSSMNSTLKELGYNRVSAGTVKAILFKYNIINKPQ